MTAVFSKDQSKLFAEKFMELGNLSIAGVVLTQFVSSKRFDERVALLGFVVFAVFYLLAYFLTRRR